MKNRINTTWFSLGFAGFLTLGKFFFWYLSGSMAVLSEAWHSFSDIATSFVILLSLYQNRALAQRASLTQPPLPDDPDKTNTLSDKGRSFVRWILDINPELKISIFIGSILLCISSAVLWNVITSEPAELKRPLLTGLFFLIFSAGSYLLYRVQTGVGQKEQSAALHADGIHSRADALISFLTGLTLLIFYYFNINLDRYMGGLIAFIIFLFSMEILLNSMLCFVREKDTYTQEYTTANIVGMLFRRQTYKKVGNFLSDVLLPPGKQDFKQGLIKGFHIARKLILLLMISTVCITYFSTCFYVVDTGHHGIKLRFGKIINSAEPDPAGLHLKFPWPFESSMTLNTQKISTLTVGNQIIPGRPLIWAQEHGDNMAFISGDNTLFLPYTSIHFKIKDPTAYYTHSKEPEKLIKSMALSLLTREFSCRKFYDLALYKRIEWIKQVSTNLQNALDSLDCGIEIVNINVQDLHPPSTVSPSFENVVAALQKKEQLLNEAQAFKNEYLPKTRGEAYKTMKKAQIYVDDKTKKADGEARNYLSRLDGYKTNPQILKKLLFYKAAQEAIKPAGKKIIVDPSTGINSKDIYNEQFLFRLDRR
jgi:membrane protease subunit HflK